VLPGRLEECLGMPCVWLRHAQSIGGNAGTQLGPWKVGPFEAPGQTGWLVLLPQSQSQLVLQEVS